MLATMELDFYLFMIIKDAISPKWARTYDMAVGHDIPPLRIHHKAGGLTGHGRVGVKRRRLAEMNRHHALDHLLDGLLPFGGICLGSGGPREGHLRGQAVGVMVEVGSEFGVVVAVHGQFVIAVLQVQVYRGGLGGGGRRR